MDGFDDLLNPSRSALEENPFANPFSSARSSSPDPWATPFASNDPAEDAFGSSANHFASSDSYSSNPYESSSGPNTAPAPAVTEETSTDPLDSATAQLTDDDDDKPLGKLRSPGFRESVPVFSETATIRPPFIEEPDLHAPPQSSQSPPPAPLLPSSSTTSTTNPAPTSPSIIEESYSAERSTSSTTPLPPSATENKFVVSPLEGASGLHSSLADLSLGGSEPFGGGVGWHAPADWQTDRVSSLPPITQDQHSAEDSDDDKPIAETLKAREHDDSSTVQRAKRDEHGIAPVFVITVDDPQKVGDPIRGFTMYTVHTRTTSPNFLKSAFSVLRRYSDFLWIYETLSTNNPGVVVPPVPEKNTFGRFDDQFVRQRRLALEKCIQKIANHPILGKDPDLRLFLESDTFSLDIKHRKAEIAHERGGLIASIGQSITGPRFYETDEWFDRQKSYLDGLETQLRGLAKAIEQVSKHRSELAAATGEFAQSVSDLSASDVGKQLSQSLSGLADVERKAQELQTIQSEQDISTISATVDEYARLINSVRLAFASRIRVYHSWKNSEAELLRIKQNHEKNRAQGRIPTDRLGFSLQQIAEAERRAVEAKHEYEQVSKLVKTEVARFEQERIEDFKDSLHAFLEGMISRQKELIETWENYQQALLRKVGGGGAPPPVASAAPASASPPPLPDSDIPGPSSSPWA